MSNVQITKDSTSVSVELIILDNTTGLAELGVVFNEAGIDLNYRRDGAFVTSITEIDLTTPDLEDAWESGGFLEIANGRYRFDVPDAAFATGVDKVTIGGDITGMIVIPVVVQLTDVDLFDGVRGGMTALPNAAADGAFGLPISDAGGLDMDATDAAVAAIPTTAMRGTDSAALASVATEARLAELDPANIPADIDAIPTTAMRGTDSAALASVATEARLAELDAANLPSDVDDILADTNEIQASLADGGFTNLILDLIQVETDKLGDAMPDSIAADGSINTPIQALYMIQQVLTDFKIVGTTLTVRKVDGTTTLFTSTLDDATNPTDVSRET